MEIQEAKNEEEQLISYIFEQINNPVLEDKTFKEYLSKWGLQQSIRVQSFRFNQKYDDLSHIQFFKDFFNDQAVKAGTGVYNSKTVQEIKLEKLKCTQVKLDMFQNLKEFDIVSGDNIKQCIPDYYEEIEICTNLRQALLVEESEYWEAFTEEQRQEFLFKVFSLLYIGGGMCQYDDQLSVYLEWTKFLYKNLISARKDTESENVFVESQVYEIKKVDDTLNTEKHPQNVFYVVINPSLRSVNALFSGENSWSS
ncbi:hypothetical protein PPERSA_03079 [Pseudocohnilembus persalinus]|uniref:Cilia- and flagella-associated protein 300 n=1 Tax=Pseudocohnilembus persalinus TaxID=266149 RepID=A0A0V0QLI3_PSEPJ|nr:hypothetical protein PPERSA_03079 [Pseudocohnilembus persalinus]|eukprot:KRX02988.1 hypothetical protein PPERSA_03079 [Pseudocohnilembus persalinus]